VRPFVAIPEGVIEVLVARDAKDTAFLQLASQWNDIKVKKPKFSFVPAGRRILLGSALKVTKVQFLEETLVPFLLQGG
jgi:hypothetical protein